MITGIQSWQIIQQKDGVGSVTLTIDVEKITMRRPSWKIVALKYCFLDEETDAPVTPWVKAQIEENHATCTIGAIPVGGLYYLSQEVQYESGLCLREFATGIRHVGVGDVFLIAGQSNAAGWGKGVMTEAPEIGINVLRKENYWDLATNPLGEFHSPFMSFAKLLHKKLGYPIGLIPRAVGGVPIKDWMPGGSLIRRVERESKAAEMYPNIAAVLWYQGCTDAFCDAYLKYKENFTAFATQIREVFQNDRLPIFTFQLNRYQDKKITEDWEIGWSAVREAQRTMPQYVNDVHVIPTIDALKMSDGIHNGKCSNIMLGERLGYYVLGELYHIGKNYKAPNLRTATIENRVVRLAFDDVASGLCTYNVKIDQVSLSVCDDEGEIALADYSVGGNQIELILEREAVGEAYVSGMSGLFPKGAIFDNATLMPMLCFDRVKAEKGAK